MVPFKHGHCPAGLEMFAKCFQSGYRFDLMFQLMTDKKMIEVGHLKRQIKQISFREFHIGDSLTGNSIARLFE